MTLEGERRLFGRRIQGRRDLRPGEVIPGYADPPGRELFAPRLNGRVETEVTPDDELRTRVLRRGQLQSAYVVGGNDFDLAEDRGEAIPIKLRFGEFLVRRKRETEQSE